MNPVLSQGRNNREKIRLISNDTVDSDTAKTDSNLVTLGGVTSKMERENERAEGRIGRKIWSSDYRSIVFSRYLARIKNLFSEVELLEQIERRFRDANEESF